MHAFFRKHERDFPGCPVVKDPPSNLGDEGLILGLPWWPSGKQSACNAGDSGSIPESESSSGEGNGNPLQYSYLGNPMDRRAWQATVHGVATELDTT